MTRIVLPSRGKWAGMKRLRMENGSVVEAGAPEHVPWCPECEAFAVPDESGECGDCGATVVFKDDA